MLFTIHEQKNKAGNTILKKEKIVEENLYDEMRKKKEKLIQQLRTEKVINPKCQEDVDKAIASIKKEKCGYGKVGRIQYFYESLKGFYFYIHKIVEQEGTYTDTIRFYCSNLDETMYKECQKDDKLISEPLD